MRKIVSIIILVVILAATVLLVSDVSGEEMYPGVGPGNTCDPLDPANQVPYPGVEQKFWGWTCPQPTLAAQDQPEPTPTAWQGKIARPGRSR